MPSFPPKKRLKNKNWKSQSVEYIAWSNMKRRCNINSKLLKRKDMKSYLNRLLDGKAMDPSWLNFDNFLSDMGRRPEGKTSLGRIDNRKGYYPDNCRWETWEEQLNNTSRNVKHNYQGKELSVNDLVKFSTVSARTISRRISSGWTVEKAVKSPALDALKNLKRK